MANSNVRTSAGTTLSISAGLSSAYTVAELAALTYTKVGEISDLGSFGKKSTLATFVPVSERKTVKRKGSYNNGTLSLKMGASVTDAGQMLMTTASGTDFSYTFRVVTQSGSTYYFTGQVMSFVLEIGSVDQIMGASSDIEIDNDIVFQSSEPAPAVVATPSTINGTPTVGTPLSITPGTFSGGYPIPSVTSTIYANGSPVSTSGNYTPVPADVGKVFTVDYVASNLYGDIHNMSAASTACVAAQSAATIVSAPVINGTPTVGTPLSITSAVFTGANPAATITRNIYANNIVVSTASTYTPVSGDINKVFKVEDIATNSVGSPSSVSANSAACVAANSAATAVNAPVISGTPTVGTPLSITAGTFSGANPAATITRKIYASNVVVASGNSSTGYTPVTGDIGKTFKVEDIATNSVNATSNMSATSAACVASGTTPQPSGTSNAVGKSATGSTAI